MTEDTPPLLREWDCQGLTCETGVPTEDTMRVLGLDFALDALGFSPPV